MSKILEVIDSLNNENVDEIKEQLISETKALNENNRQLYQRAKKAEGFEYNKETKEWVKKEAKEKKENPKPNIESPIKSNEPDYAKLAFLEQRGIINKEDQKLIQDEAERLKMPLTDILSMEHIKSQLKNAKDQREASEGTPKGRGKSGSSSQKDIDYWLAKNKTPEDQELAEKVIEARMKKEESGNKFSDELFTG